MRHHSKNRKFGREKNQREALLRSLMRSLLRDGKIVTTEAKAKEIRPHIEKLITLGKKGDAQGHRLVLARIGDQEMAAKHVRELSQKYNERKGGYTRITKLSPKTSDRRKMAMIEFV